MERALKVVVSMVSAYARAIGKTPPPTSPSEASQGGVRAAAIARAVILQPIVLGVVS